MTRLFGTLLKSGRLTGCGTFLGRLVPGRLHTPDRTRVVLHLVVRTGWSTVIVGVNTVDFCIRL